MMQNLSKMIVTLADGYSSESAHVVTGKEFTSGLVKWQAQIQDKVLLQLK